MTTHTATQAAPMLARTYQDSIALVGRLSILYAPNGRQQALHGSFTWDQHADHISLSLLSPLGQTLALIDVNAGVAVLTQAGQAAVTATDVDALTQQALGWPLPVAGMRDWLQGFGHSTDGQPFVAQPGSESSNFVTDDGWNLTYGAWQDDAANTLQNRPKRIDLKRQTEQAGAVSIRIVIDKWQRGAASMQ